MDQRCLESVYNLICVYILLVGYKLPRELYPSLGNSKVNCNIVLTSGFNYNLYLFTCSCVFVCLVYMCVCVCDVLHNSTLVQIAVELALPHRHITPHNPHLPISTPHHSHLSFEEGVSECT